MSVGWFVVGGFFLGSVPNINAMLCIYIVICVYIVRSTPLSCMHVCMDRRHVSASMKVRRRPRRLVATK